MRPCDLCGTGPIARVGYLGERSDRRVWLCPECHARLEAHELTPVELLGLARRAAQRSGRCDWCAASPPTAQVRIRGEEGRVLAFHLCGKCALEAERDAGGQILRGQPARQGETIVDPRYARALEVTRRRRQMHRVK